MNSIGLQYMEFFDAQSLHFRYSPILLSFQLRMVRYLPIREIPFQGGGSPFPVPDSHWLKLLPSFGALIIPPFERTEIMYKDADILQYFHQTGM